MLNTHPIEFGEAPACIHSTAIRGFWSHLSAIADIHGMISVHVFDLMDVHRLAPDVTICDVDIETCRQRIRFVGTRVVAVFGAETTGQFLDEVDLGPFRSQQLAAFNMAVATGRPQWTRARVATGRAYPLEQIIPSGASYERLICPLVQSDSKIAQLATIMRYDETTCENSEFEHKELAL